MAKLIPVAIWYNPADGATCPLCWDLISVFQGMPFIVGSAEYWMAMGTFHPNCRWYYVYTVMPLSEYKEPPPLTEAIPADSSTWDIAFTSFMPIAALGYQTDRIAGRDVKRKQGAVQEGTPVYNEDDYQSARQKLRTMIRQSALTIDEMFDRIVKKFGVNGVLAFNEANL